MLPTDQTPNVHLMNFVAAQTRRIAISPDESLGVGRDQLTMVVDQATIRVKEQQAVVKRSMARSVLNTFVYPYDNSNPQLGSRFCKRCRLRSRNNDAVCSQLCKGLLYRCVVPKGRLLTIIQPSRIARQEGLAKTNKLGPPRGLFGQSKCLCKRGRQIGVHRRRLDNGDANRSVIVRSVAQFSSQSSILIIPG